MRGPHAPNPPTTSLSSLPTNIFFRPPLSLYLSSFLSPRLAFVLFVFISFGGFREKVWMDLPRADAPLPFGDETRVALPPAFRARRLPFPPSPSSSSSLGGTDGGWTDGRTERRARTAGRWTKNGVRGRWAIRWTYPSTPLLLSPSPGAKESLSSWSPEMPLSVPCYLCHFCFALS